MTITLNGQALELAAPATVAALIEQLKLGERRVAVELNGEIVPRSRIGQVAVRAGDRIEIVHAIGGG